MKNKKAKQSNKRTELAFERTALAYIRTALTIFITGAGLLKFFPKLMIIQTVAWGFMGLGIILAIFGVIKAIDHKKRIDELN